MGESHFRELALCALVAALIWALLASYSRSLYKTDWEAVLAARPDGWIAPSERVYYAESSKHRGPRILAERGWHRTRDPVGPGSRLSGLSPWLGTWLKPFGIDISALDPWFSMFGDSALDDYDVVIDGVGRDAALIWLRSDRKIRKIARTDGSQMVNQLSTMSPLVNKHELWRNLEGAGLAEFQPETVRMYDSDECTAFFARRAEREQHNASGVWILKPSTLSQGQGMEIFAGADGIATLADRFVDPETGACRPMEVHSSCDGRDACMTQYYILQKYIDDPFLLHGKYKSETRLYWLVVSLDPLVVLTHVGTVRRNALPYVHGDYDNKFVHITNVKQQKAHPEYESFKDELKVPFAELQRQLDAHFGNDFGSVQLMDRMRRMIAGVVLATIVAPGPSGPGGRVKRQKGRFALFGADFIIDQSANVWLSEIQLNPGMSASDPVKRHLIPELVGSAIDAAMQARFFHTHGVPFVLYEPPGNWTTVVNEADILENFDSRVFGIP